MKKVLLVDNDRVLLGLISKFLEKKEYEVETVDNGIDALDVLKAFTPDAIILDLVMPNIDGKSLCRVIRGMDRFKDIYIIILSAISAEKWVDVSEFGADACIAKGPFDEMSQHILAALNQPETTSGRCLSGEILGVKSVFPRGITHELLLVKEHFELILDRMSEGILEINAEGRIVFANSAILSMVAIPVKNLLGSYFVDLFTGDEYTRICDLIGNQVQGGKRIPEDYPILLNKHYIALDFLSLDEKALKSLIIVRDVTEHKRVTDLLRGSEKKYRNLIEKSDDIIWSTDLSLHTIYVSSAVERKLGFTTEERRSQALEEQVTPSSYKRLLELLTQELTLEKEGKADPDRTVKVEVEYYHKNGSTLWFENVISGLRDGAGHLCGVHGISRDITGRKEAENALLQERDKLQAAIRKIKTLSGMLPICSHCKKIRDDKGYWNQIETYIRDHSEAEFSHSICQECAKEHYPDLHLYDDDKETHD